MDVNYFQILLLGVFNMIKRWYLFNVVLKKGRNRIDSGPAVKGLMTKCMAVLIEGKGQIKNDKTRWMITMRSEVKW